MITLGISALYHDSAAALVRDGRIVAAAQEERFTRRKHDNSLPFHAIDYCLRTAGVRMHEVDAVAYYDRPELTLDRYLHNVLSLGSDASAYLQRTFDELISQRLTVDANLRRRYGMLGRQDRLYALEHHLSHAASAFYPSPFEHAAFLTVDGVGEWATCAMGQGSGTELTVCKQIDYPHSLGLFYSAFTAFCGFRVNSGDYKFMGLAPYGDPVYYDLIRDRLIDLRPDGSFRLNLEYFDFYRGTHMTNARFAALFGGEARTPESRITRREMDIAASVQKVTEEAVLGLAHEARRVFGERNLVMAGGVALNCVANGKLQKSGIFDDIWVQSAAGDAGGALGCALYAYYRLSGQKRIPEPDDAQQGSYLGPEFSDAQIRACLDSQHAVYSILSPDKIAPTAAGLLAEGKIIGWFQGRMEFGPRALGHRSILADPRDAGMQSRLNLSIKYRESFRPFAPSVLAEDADRYFDLRGESPYMLKVAEVLPSRRLPFDRAGLLARSEGDMLPLISAPHSDIPAVTHVDFSARIQTVTKSRNGLYYDLLSAFRSLTGCSVLINTSFNVRGEPIVCTPLDAYRCFMRTGMDALVIGRFLLLKTDQGAWKDETDWRKQYELD